MPRRMCHPVVPVIVACSLLALAGCEDLMKQLPAGTDRYLQTGISVGSAVMNRPTFTEADEERMAQENAKKYESSHQLWDDPLLDTYLNDVVQRLVAQARPRPFVYSIRVVNDASINAFTFGGGLLYVNAGLLARMENEAQLAMVLAHEIAHVTESHVTKGIEGSYGIQVLGQLAAQAAETSGKVTLPPALLQKTYEYSMKAAISGHGRASETEADVVGLEYMVKAGYDPREAPKTLEQLLKEYGDQGALENFFYGDHPTNKSRIAKLTGLVQSKYSQELASRKLLVNTDEFNRRTRELVVNVGKLDYERKRFKTAAAMFEKALAAKDNDPVLHYYLGKIALETESGPEASNRAIGHFVAAIKANEAFADAYREMGLAYFKLGDRKTAAMALEKYLSLSPGAKDADRIRRALADLQGS
ncbi:MAG TPA: tetratricopeptide repeat protein [Nitrospiraceae bacterium]|jgi:predicted Zn-dependent protease|nr:tetratricopeptide repeat protein [Nitrospiraceae bacterium]